MKFPFAAAACWLALGAGQAHGTTYAIDPTHTFVSFEVGHFDTSINRGRWDRKEGTVEFDRAARTGRVEITLDMNSINSGVAQFDGQLKSKEFFNVAEHPSARFVGDKFVFDGDKLSAVEGTLTLLGRSHPVTLQARQFNCYTNPIFKREVCGGDFEATIQRSQWGITYGMPLVAPDSVRLLVQIEAIRQ